MSKIIKHWGISDLRSCQVCMEDGIKRRAEHEVNIIDRHTLQLCSEHLSQFKKETQAIKVRVIKAKGGK